MGELNEIYGAALALPSELSGILISDAPAPHEGANGLYSLGVELNGFPTYYFGDYVIANWYGENYALYHKDWAGPDADNEIWYLGPNGTGPVAGGLLDEPYPTVQGLGTVGEGLPAALLQDQSPENALPNYPSASTMPGSPVNPLTVPVASTLPSSSENPISTPAATVLPASTLHPVSNFTSSLKPPGFPSYLIEPPSPSVSVRSTSAAVSVKVVTFDGTQFRVRNQRTGTVTPFSGSGTILAVPILPNDWNLLTLEIEGDVPSNVKTMDVNLAAPRISGSFVLHASRYLPRYGTLSGASWLSAQILDLQLPVSLGNLNFWDFGRTNLSAQLIDRLLITADTATNPTGALAYSNNPGSPDALRSTAALAALNSLLAKGWTITR